MTYSVPEAAQIVGISQAAAYRCVRSGEIPSVTLGGRIVVPRKALADLLGLDEV
jgi:excisionase family DNA binding protein